MSNALGAQLQWLTTFNAQIYRKLSAVDFFSSLLLSVHSSGLNCNLAVGNFFNLPISIIDIKLKTSVNIIKRNVKGKLNFEKVEVGLLWDGILSHTCA